MACTGSKETTASVCSQNYIPWCHSGGLISVRVGKFTPQKRANTAHGVFFVLIFFPGDVVAKHFLTYPPGYDSNPGGLIPERFGKDECFHAKLLTIVSISSLRQLLFSGYSVPAKWTLIDSQRFLTGLL